MTSMRTSLSTVVSFCLQALAKTSLFLFPALEAGGGWEISFLFKIKMLIVQEMVLSKLLGSEKLEEGILAYVTETPT